MVGGVESFHVFAEEVRGHARCASSTTVLRPRYRYSTYFVRVVVVVLLFCVHVAGRVAGEEWVRSGCSIVFVRWWAGR